MNDGSTAHRAFGLKGINTTVSDVSSRILRNRVASVLTDASVALDSSYNALVALLSEELSPAMDLNALLEQIRDAKRRVDLLQQYMPLADRLASEVDHA
jgi:hypothetical protein